MNIRDLLYETWHALLSNKGRSFLTVLGIVIGISAVITMTSLIGGVQNMLVDALGLNQSRILYLSVSTTKPIDWNDLEEIKKGVDGYEFLTGGVYGYADISTGEEAKVSTSIEGVRPEYFSTGSQKLILGRFFDQDEEKRGEQVCVISQSMVKELYGDFNYNPCGQIIRIGNDEYTIIGIIESTSMVSMGVSVYMPYSTAQTRVTGNIGISEIAGYAKEGVDIKKLSEETKSFCARYFGVADPNEDIFVMDMQSVIAELETMMTAFSAIMAAVAGISLLVGGIGIMNMMLTNVTERIKEIGLRKSLGARKRDITRQFLLESVALCVAGGIFGIIFGLVGAWLLSIIIALAQPDMAISPAVSIASIAVAVGVCVFIGLVFGYYPARRAAKLDPVESLRYQ